MLVTENRGGGAGRKGRGDLFKKIARPGGSPLKKKGQAVHLHPKSNPPQRLLSIRAAGGQFCSWPCIMGSCGRKMGKRLSLVSAAQPEGPSFSCESSPGPVRPLSPGRLRPRHSSSVKVWASGHGVQQSRPPSAAPLPSSPGPSSRAFRGVQPTDRQHLPSIATFGVPAALRGASKRTRTSGKLVPLWQDGSCGPGP